MAQITENGFQKQSFSDILEEMVSTAKNIFGDDIDLRDETFLKQLMVVIALRDAQKEDALEDIYNNYSVTQATMTSLDYAVKFQGLRRKEATKSTVTITFTGDDGTIINSGYIVQTPNEIKFKTNTSGTISGGSVDIECEALIAGADGNVLAGTITEVESPLVGLESINNSLDATGGLNKESDESLRTRYLLSLARGGGSTADAIRAGVLTLENVTDAKIFENQENIEVDGIPPKAFQSYILGGDAEEIQDVIFQLKGVGIQSDGTITKDYVDDNGNDITIGIDRPTSVDVWVEATITGGTDYPVDGDTQVENTILQYFDNLLIGQDVLVFGLSNYIANNVDGILNISIETSLDGTTFNPADVTIQGDVSTAVEVALTDSGKVTVV